MRRVATIFLVSLLLTNAGSAADGEWPVASGSPQALRFSDLTEINTKNVARLKPSFTFNTGLHHGEESATLVVGSTMYFVTPFPNYLYALDLTKPGAPVKWKFDPHADPASQGEACCDTVNRGPAYADGKVVMNTLDGQTIAVDAATGKELWRAHLANIRIGETLTMAPMIAEDKVLVGNSGGEFGVRGWIAALNLKDGSMAWKAFHTGPDKDVLIGSDFHPFYPQDRGKNLGIKTWPADRWKQGGGNVWGWVSYDPQARLVIYGTGNPGPWNPDQRPGENKWTSGVFARDVDSGQARWFYQWSPHDLYDHDGINENILVDRDWKGSPRKLLLHPGRNGYLYVLDRTNGQVLSAKPFVYINSSFGVDLKSGKLIPNPAKHTQTGKTVYDICPTAAGAKDWEPSAYSPRTGFVYIPHANLCMDEEGVQASYIAGTPYVGAIVRQKPGHGGYRGAMTAWDVAGEKIKWDHHENMPVWSGALVTAGDVVFYGTLDGWFRALDARSGKLLWQYRTDSGIVGQPVAYKGPDGHEYIAILSGVGGWIGAVLTNRVDVRDSTGANGMASAVPDLPRRGKTGGRLYVFRLG
ncbi:MAG: PQQ-dependent dehydrogenase, methanol/ethanol family [Alphaproteobacteria bacterium]|nr:PQQ-dependent dehydrogenase, methanol/ethanol family [Alphaproteobacteria bacterium]